MSYNLFLDDDRMPEQVGNYMLPVDLRVIYRKYDWVIVRNFSQFVKHIMKHGLPNIVSFDHDLADIHYNPKIWRVSIKYRENTGMDCAKWLIEYMIKNNHKQPIHFYVHSQNHVGKENITNLLFNWNKQFL